MKYKPRCTTPPAKARDRRREKKLADPERTARLARWLETKDLSIDVCPACRERVAHTPDELQCALETGALLACPHCRADLVLAVTGDVAHLAVATEGSKARSIHALARAERELEQRAMAGDADALAKVYGRAR